MGQDIGSNPMSPTPATPTINAPGTPKSPLPCPATTPTKTPVSDAIKSSPGSVWSNICVWTCVIMSFPKCCNLFSSPQGSPRVPSLAAPAGRHLAQQSGRCHSAAAGHVAALSPDREPPGGGLPAPGAGGVGSARPGLRCWRPAGHAGAPDSAPDQDAGVGGGQGPLTGDRLESSEWCFVDSYTLVVTASLCVSTGRGVRASEESVYQQSGPGANHPVCVGRSSGQTPECITWQPGHQPQLPCCAAGGRQLQHQTGAAACFQPEGWSQSNLKMRRQWAENQKK